MLIRREGAADRDAARSVHVAAFRSADPASGLPDTAPEPIEAALLDALRTCDGWMPELSWVAELDGRIVGHCISTIGAVGEIAVPGLGPIGVLPELQSAGVGSALMYASLGSADALGYPLIALLGDPGYYSRFGFVRSTDLGIDPPEPEWGVHFQVRTLSAWAPSLTGTFAYAAPFRDL